VNQVGQIILIKEIKMSKKILLLSSVFFLSSCAATSISELGDKFLDLINPSEAPSEVIDLSEPTLVLIDGDGGFTEEELEVLSNDELIEIAKEKGLEDMLEIDADGNLQNRDEIINALLEAEALLDNATQELQSLSNDALIERAEEKGMDSVVVSGELKSLSNDELIEIAKDKGMEDTLVLDADGNLLNKDEVVKALTDNLIILDEDGNIQNKDEVVEALREGAEETKLAVLLLENAGITSTLYFSYDDSEIDEVATRIIIEHANFMQSNPSFNLRLEGHADERGTREYNLALGENRALNVKEVLGLYNLEDRIVVVSYGEEQPILTGSNEEAWEKNRRVEFSYY
jgi:peptidoglycan-associated lipoprotein